VRRLERALIGNHRPNAFVTPNETLVDIVVHGLDVAVPLGIDIEVPDATALRVIELLQGYRGTSKQKVFGPIVAQPDESADQRQQILALSGRTHP